MLKINISPETVKPRQTIRCNWTYMNTWTQGHSFKILFYLDGKQIKSEPLGWLKPDEVRVGSFTFTAPEKTGQHELKAISYIYVEGNFIEDETDKAIFTVQSGKPKPKITLVSVRDKETGITWNVNKGGSITVSHGNIEIIVSVKNEGDDGSVKIECYVDGNIIGSKGFSMKSGEIQTTTFETSLTTGSHKVEIRTGHY